MASRFFIWPQCFFKRSLLVCDTCPILKFTSNLKPQARNMCYKLFSNTFILHYQRRINLLDRPSWNESFINYNFIKSNSILDSKRLFYYNIGVPCSNKDLFKIEDRPTCKTFYQNKCHGHSAILNPCMIEGFLSRSYSSNKKAVVNNKHLAIKRNDYIKGVLREKQRKIRQTQQHLKKSGQLLLNDIKETKSKMKVKMEEIIERENIWTIPNLLCVTRIAMSPYLGYLIMHADYSLALWLVVFAGVTDLLDGLIARTFKSQSSKLGSFLDPMADKVLISTLFLTLTLSGNMPVPLTVLIIARDAVLFSAGFYIRYQSLPPPRTLSRYFDMTHATAQLAPTTLSKINTMIQLTTVFTTLTAVVFEYGDHPVVHGLWYMTAASTIASALSYLTQKDTYKILKRKKFR